MKRIISILLLSFMMVSLVTPIIISYKENNCVKLESITVQEELMEANNVIIPEIVREETTGSETETDFDITLEEMNQKMSEIESIEDKQEWFVAYKDIINEYSYIIDPPESIYDYYSDEELDLLFRVIQAEVGDEYSFEQKANVASVIFNRLEHDRFDNTIKEILTPDQFSTVSSGIYKKVEVSETTILACEYTFEIEDTTNGCLFFDSNNTLKYEFVFPDGAHNFYKLKGENK